MHEHTHTHKGHARPHIQPEQERKQKRADKKLHQESISRYLNGITSINAQEGRGSFPQRLSAALSSPDKDARLIK